MARRLVKLSKRETSTARRITRKYEPDDAARRLGIASPITLYKALAGRPISALTAERIRNKLNDTL